MVGLGGSVMGTADTVDRLFIKISVLVSSLVRLVRRDVHRWQKSQS